MCMRRNLGFTANKGQLVLAFVVCADYAFYVASAWLLTVIVIYPRPLLKLLWQIVLVALITLKEG